MTTRQQGHCIFVLKLNASIAMWQCHWDSSAHIQKIFYSNRWCNLPDSKEFIGQRRNLLIKVATRLWFEKHSIRGCGIKTENIWQPTDIRHDNANQIVTSGAHLLTQTPTFCNTLAQFHSHIVSKKLLHEKSKLQSTKLRTCNVGWCCRKSLRKIHFSPMLTETSVNDEWWRDENCGCTNMSGEMSHSHMSNETQRHIKQCRG